MAEFRVVIKKRNEMCECTHCTDYPLHHINECTRLRDVSDEQLIEIEEIIMNWQKPIDWSKVAVDTKILVKDYEHDNWSKRYFAKYENGKVYAYSSGATSWNGENIFFWKYAKLWEGEE